MAGVGDNFDLRVGQGLSRRGEGAGIFVDDRLTAGQDQRGYDDRIDTPIIPPWRPR